MIRKIHIFHGGPTISSTGRKMVYTEDMLQEIVDSYNPNVHEGPVVFGHSGDNRIHFSQPIDGKPAGGWIKKLVREGLDLYAEVETTPLGEQAISDKLYKKVSASFYSPKMPTSPTPGKWALRHVALLGAEPPAIKGLKNFVYAETNENEQELTFLLDENFAPTKVSELSPIEQLRKLYEKYQERKAKEEAKKNEIAKKSNNKTTPAEVSNTPSEPTSNESNTGDVNFAEYLIDTHEYLDFLEFLMDEDKYDEFKELLMITKKEDMEFGCGDKKKKDSMSYEEEKETKKSKGKKIEVEVEVEDNDDDEKAEDGTEKDYSEGSKNPKKIKKPSDKVMHEDLDEVGTTEDNLEEDKHSVGKPDTGSIDDEVASEKAGTTDEDDEDEERQKVSSDKGAQEKDKAGSGSGKSLHPMDKDNDKKGKKVNYSEEDLLGNNNYAELSERLAALEAQLATEQARSAQLERESTIRDFQEFATELYNRGSLTENLYPSEKLVDLLTKLQYNEIEFSEDSSPALEVMNLLGKLPQMVDFNDYSEDDLKPVKEDSDPLTRAVALSEEKNIEFSEAIKLVLYPQETK